MFPNLLGDSNRFRVSKVNEGKDSGKLDAVKDIILDGDGGFRGITLGPKLREEAVPEFWIYDPFQFSWENTAKPNGRHALMDPTSIQTKSSELVYL